MELAMYYYKQWSSPIRNTRGLCNLRNIRNYIFTSMYIFNEKLQKKYKMYNMYISSVICLGVP